MAEYDPAVHGPLTGERARFDPELEELQRARRGDVQEQVFGRISAFGEALQGRTPETTGMTDKERVSAKLQLIELLNARDKVKSELEKQEMRYSYQARTADATVLTALAGIIES